MMEILIPTLLGFKATTVGAIVYTAMSAFVLKAVGVASLALFLSLTLLVSKLFSHPTYVKPKHIEIEAHASEQHPIYEYPPSEHGEYNQFLLQPVQLFYSHSFPSCYSGVKP